MCNVVDIGFVDDELCVVEEGIIDVAGIMVDELSVDDVLVDEDVDEDEVEDEVEVEVEVEVEDILELVEVACVVLDLEEEDVCVVVSDAEVEDIAEGTAAFAFTYTFIADSPPQI